MLKINFPLKVLIYILLLFCNATADSFIRIVVLGSSTAAGTGPDNPDNAWVNRYRDYLNDNQPNSEVINLADGGLTTYDIMPDNFTPPPGRPSPNTNRNITEALSLNPSAVIINLPSNDNALGYSIAEQLSNYDIIIANGVSQNVPVWICSPQPVNYGSTINALQMEMRDSTFSRYINTIDFWNGLAQANGNIIEEYNADGTHLNDAGHAILFQRVADSDSDTPLPVTLTRFEAISKNKLVVLQWITETEIENEAFILEKSIDGKNYFLLAEIEGNGTTIYRTEYEYNDIYVRNGTKYYYRLSTRDYGGSVVYYKTITATPYFQSENGISNLTVFPNPFNSKINIRFTIIDKNITSHSFRLDIYNILGEFIKTIYNNTSSTGEYSLSWDGTDANGIKQASGIYFIHFFNLKHILPKRIILVN